MRNQNELHDSRLATTDEKGFRVFLHPEDVKGIWQKRKKFFYGFLIFLYLVLPWIYIEGKQWVLLDIPKREFHLFGTLFYAHDAPLLIFLLLGFLLSIAFITSIWGRVWCGWACPQTVFIDSIFRRIERFIEGNARKRKALDKEKFNSKKILKRTVKWTLFTIVSLHIVHSFLGYFVGTHNLLKISLHSPSENLSLFITMIFLTALILFDFGWFREQFCIIACPYGRFQSVLMDERSMVVAYDYNRGEPRRSIEVQKENEGDCINCYHCVKACPTGIDIRRGTQLECIACTNCIDACDEIMQKVKKPTGLIKYTSEDELEGKEKKRSLRPLVYLVLLISLLTSFVAILLNRSHLQVTVLRGSSSPYQSINSNLISNHFKMKVTSHFDRTVPLKVEEINNDSEFKIIIVENPYSLKSGINEINLFIEFDRKSLTRGHGKLKLILKNDTNHINMTEELNLVGPFN